MIIRVIPSPNGRGKRCFIRERRWHHGKTGVYFVVAGILMMIHDIRDRKVWFGVEFYQDLDKRAGEE